jgi:tetratricopeptide (TPR) repeat protein
LVRTDLVIGSCYTDEDEPLLAEEALLGAVERLDGVLSRLESRGVSPGALAPFQALQSNALVSLAVNANVRLGQPDRALEYYERAYALRQDEFMHVLLACYRARSGQSVEARRVLRRVRPGPRTWYNMACTYALLGESTSALDMLEHELKENHASEASRNRQRAWAAGDPDLASLREDPRFQALTRKTDR